LGDTDKFISFHSIAEGHYETGETLALTDMASALLFQSAIVTRENNKG